MLNIFAVIPFFNGYRYVEGIVASIVASVEAVSCVVFVDNTNDEAYVHRDSFFVGDVSVKFLRVRAGIGFGRACNLGYAHAKREGADYIIFLNQDATIFPDTIGGLLEALRGGYDVVGPVQVLGDEGVVSDFVRDHYLFQHEALRGVGQAKLLPKGVWKVSMLSGACLMMAVELPDELGLFDPLYFMYGEDNDFARRLTRHEKKVGLVSHSLIKHEHSNYNASSRRRIEINAWMRYAGSVRLLKDELPGFGVALSYVVVRRCWHYIRALMEEDVEFSVRNYVALDAKLLRNLGEIYEARRGESVIDRMHRYIEMDAGF